MALPFIAVGNNNSELWVYPLSDDYLSVKSGSTGTDSFPSQRREAPAIVKINSTYYLITSWSSGWDFCCLHPSALRAADLLQRHAPVRRKRVPMALIRYVSWLPRPVRVAGRRWLSQVDSEPFVSERVATTVGPTPNGRDGVLAKG